MVPSAQKQIHYPCIYMCVYIYIYTYMCVCVFVLVHIQLKYLFATRTNTKTLSSHIHTHTHIHTYITCIHTYIQVSIFFMDYGAYDDYTLGRNSNPPQVSPYAVTASGRPLFAPYTLIGLAVLEVCASCIIILFMSTCILCDFFWIFCFIPLCVCIHTH